MIAAIITLATHTFVGAEIVSIEGDDKLYMLESTDVPHEYTITQYMQSRKEVEAYTIEPPVRDWYVPRKIPFVHRCYKARPLQQDYG